MHETHELNELRFDFEDFLEEQEHNLPDGLDPLYLSFVPILENPLSNIRKLPTAVVKLPVNAILHQSWKSLAQIYLIIFMLALPSMVIQSAYMINFDNGTMNGILIFFVILGSAGSFAYLKIVHQILNNLINTKKSTWLVDEVKAPFDELYQSPWNRQILRIAFILNIFPEIKLLSQTWVEQDFGIAWSIVLTILSLIGYFGLSIMVYISMISFYFVIRNTRIYDTLLVKIIARVKGYTGGHESILTRKNYEVVRVLSDTPGLSIRSLGDIPQLGLLASILVFNSALFILVGPFLNTGLFAKGLAGLGHIGKDNTNLTYVILIGLFFSLIAAFGAVIAPLFRISRVMGLFKHKALSELDPFLFDEITNQTRQKEISISEETKLLYMLRGYIYTMKASPVSPLRLIYLGLLSLVYGLRLVPSLVAFIDG